MARNCIKRMKPEAWISLLNTLVILATISGILYIVHVNSRNTERCKMACPQLKTQTSNNVDISTGLEKSGTGPITPTAHNADEETRAESRLAPEPVPPFPPGKLAENIF